MTTIDSARSISRHMAP